jgi:hypothetical protein
MSRPVRLAALALALALAGTTQTYSSGEMTVRAAAMTDVCTGVASCSKVATVDVDGDAAADQVGIVSRDVERGGSLTVRVRTSKGRTLQTTGRHVFWFAKPFTGAVALDGRPGAEIVVGDTMGANFEQFRVVTYRDGRLVTLKAPPAVWTSAGLARSTPRWGVDGSYSFSSGIARSTSAGAGVRLTMTKLERNSSGRGHSGHRTSYRWHDGDWVKTSTVTVRSVSDRQAFALGGWHVRGLPRFS